MGVGVDKTRGHDAAAGVNNFDIVAVRVIWGECFTLGNHGFYFSIASYYIRDQGLRAGPVNDKTSFKQCVCHRIWSATLTFPVP